jgi:hypothetical protein
MAGDPALAVQAEYPPELEHAKLKTLTELFTSEFGFGPSSFRAGRFGLSPSTLESLARLGYKVDSSVTPGLIWDYPQARIDFTDWSSAPRRIRTPAGAIVELPVGVQPKGILSKLPRTAKAVRRGLQVLRRGGAFDRWLRPSWNDAAELIRYAKTSPDDVLVLMFHSMEIVPNASPYAASDADVRRIVDSMRGFFEHCRAAGIEFSGLTEAAARV